MNSKFKKLDKEAINLYIKESLLKEEKAVKNIPIKAIKITKKILDKINEKGGYTTLVRHPQTGKLVQETINKNLKIGDFLVTNLIDGYENSYVISDEKFKKLYNPTEKKYIFKPKKYEKKVYQVFENIKFDAPWGSEIKLYKGGYLVLDNDCSNNKIFYAINKEEFDSTYSIIKF